MSPPERPPAIEGPYIRWGPSPEPSNPNSERVRQRRREAEIWLQRHINEDTLILNDGQNVARLQAQADRLQPLQDLLRNLRQDP